MNAPWLGLDAARRLHVCTLPWKEAEGEENAHSLFGPFDTAIGAGLLHSTGDAQTLASLLPSLTMRPAAPCETAIERSSLKPALILLAHEVRHTGIQVESGLPYDEPLAAFLHTVVINPPAPTQHWDLVVQVRSVREGDELVTWRPTI